MYQENLDRIDEAKDLDMLAFSLAEKGSLSSQEELHQDDLQKSVNSNAKEEHNQDEAIHLSEHDPGSDLSFEDKEATHAVPEVIIRGALCVDIAKEYIRI